MNQSEERFLVSREEMADIALCGFMDGSEDDHDEPEIVDTWLHVNEKHPHVCPAPEAAAVEALRDQIKTLISRAHETGYQDEPLAEMEVEAWLDALEVGEVPDWPEPWLAVFLPPAILAAPRAAEDGE